MRNFKYLFFVVSIFIFLPILSVVFADNSFTFSTDPQSVPAGQMSGKINVQSSSPVTETTYLDFTSSSPTGQFLTSTGGLLKSAYISTGDSNRAVYYEDSTAGDFVITAVVLSKAKVQITTISQHIYIGQPVPGGDQTSTTTTATTTDQSTSTDNQNNTTSNLSANSSPASLPSDEITIDFEISCGRDRLTSVGNDLTFVVKPVKTQGIISNSINYEWSFGDGSTDAGSLVHHAYKFPGKYSVVVNANASDQMAADRLTVLVVDPKISIRKVSGGLEVANNSGAEINLEGWLLGSSNKSFIFPKDTLILDGQKIIFADDLTDLGFGSGDLQIRNQLGQTYASLPGQNIVATNSVISTTSIGDLNDILTGISSVRQKLASLQSEINSTTTIPTQMFSLASAEIPKNSTSISAPALAKSQTKIPPATNNSSQTATVFVATSSPGFISRIFAWPIRGFNFIRGLFVEN